MHRLGGLAQHLHADGALARDHIGIVIGVHKAHARTRGKFLRVNIGIGIRVAVEHHLRAARLDRVHLDRGRGHRHHNQSLAMQALRCKRHTLGVIAR